MEASVSTSLFAMHGGDHMSEWRLRKSSSCFRRKERSCHRLHCPSSANAVVSLHQGVEPRQEAVLREGVHFDKGLRRCDFYDFSDQLVPYSKAWQWQKDLVAQRRAAIDDGGQNPLPDALILLQHPPVYTMGTRSSDGFLRFDPLNPPIELYRTERGGEVTYHGPGQLVMYPILDLRNHETDLHWYLRSLEEVAIRALQSCCGIHAHRIEGLTGVWAEGRKLAAVGVRVSRWITYHGMALNVTTDLSPFNQIVPCGISDRPVSSVVQLLSTSRKVQGQGRHDAKVRGQTSRGARAAAEGEEGRPEDNSGSEGCVGGMEMKSRKSWPDLGKVQSELRHEGGGDDGLLALMREGLLREFSSVFQLDLSVVKDNNINFKIE